DGFHNPREVRYRRGRLDAEGFFLDSYNYHALRDFLIDPFLAGHERVHGSRFDHVLDEPVTSTEVFVPSQCLLVFDGIFLHRDELRTLWSASIFLDVPFQTTFAR